MRHASRHLPLVILLGLSLMFCGCITARTKGDRAFEQGQYNEALDHYEELIEEGVKDPDVFYRAARASIAIGGFVDAERYFTQALQYGAGLDVARELAEFYVSTNNYASAVRVYQLLLSRDTDLERSKPIYNNMGAALMYAGRPFDAESYLMLAQQLKPKDSSPYLNLGILYDRHLKQPWLAINFYECFARLEPQDERQIQQVAQRSRELHARWSRLYDSSLVECGEPYVPRVAQQRVDLKQAMSEAGLEDSEIEDAEDSEIDIGLEDSGATGPIEVERMVEETPRESEPSPVESGPDHESVIRSAKLAHAEARHRDVVDLLTEVPLSKLKRSDREMLGASLIEIGKPREAASWLELALGQEDTPRTVELLIRAYRRSDQNARVSELCRTYRSQKDYAVATENCPEPANSADDEQGE